MIHIGGGFPSIEKTAATFRLSRSRVRQLTALMDEIQQRKVRRKARTGRNPATGEPIKIAARTTAKFYLAKAAKASERSTARKSKAASAKKASTRSVAVRQRGLSL
jgi:hypothetical protein